MVWRESSWAAHYQSPLPASDTLFTEAPGPDSPGRRQQTQGTALPSPLPACSSPFGPCQQLDPYWTSLPARPALMDPAWRAPTQPLSLCPQHPKVQPNEKRPLRGSPVSQPQRFLAWRGGHWVLVPLSRASPAHGTKDKQGDTETLRAASSFLPCRLHPWAPAREAVSDPGVVIVNE